MAIFVMTATGVTPSNAQILQASLSHYSADNGLASNTVSDICQDDYGYIWIATWNGLSRFDGYDFYNYATGYRSGIPSLHNRISDTVKSNGRRFSKLKQNMEQKHEQLVYEK